MEVTTTERGFKLIEHRGYPRQKDWAPRLVQESSAVNPTYVDAMDRPGSSYLWVGDHHHLCRAEVAELVKAMQTWLETGRLGG